MTRRQTKRRTSDIARESAASFLGVGDVTDSLRAVVEAMQAEMDKRKGDGQDRARAIAKMLEGSL